MLFRLLGPLEVADGDRPVRLGEGRQRSVLILLLLHRNEAIASERLIDALWGESPPATAAKVLQNYVGQLRRALDDREGRRLQTRGRGYVIHVQDGELDLDRFERLVRERRRGARARPTRRRGRAAARGAGAVARARRWPTSRTSRSRRPRSPGSRSGARWRSERRIDADLALGRHADLVAELEALVAEHPLRERLRGQLMLALYRCGRQAEALEAFRERAAVAGRGGRRRARPRAARAARGDPAPGRRARARQADGAAARARRRRRAGARRARPRAGVAARALGAGASRSRWLVVRESAAAGIGKTRLAAELAGEVHRAGRRRAVRVGRRAPGGGRRCDAPGAAGDASDAARRRRRRRERRALAARR